MAKTQKIISNYFANFLNKTSNSRYGFSSNGLTTTTLTNNPINGCPRTTLFFSSLSSSTATTSKEADILGSRQWGFDYEEYRRSLYGDITHKALLVDAVGTLVVPSQPMAQIYKEIGEKYGVKYTEDEILNRYRWAYGQPWGRSRLRYVDDGKPFWQFIVKSSTGCSDSEYFEELYHYYATDKAWRLCDPDADKVFKALRSSGVKVAVVSNFDTRLRLVLQALNCDHWFDAVAVSAEVSNCFFWWLQYCWELVMIVNVFLTTGRSRETKPNNIFKGLRVTRR
ncbi:hypothetical protein AQUCO_00900380v1 [Aquilegia coerulea]|uniref:Haloacid dehalogenase-like hydrolase domain-containing protein 3 n=1 Tax=Aquilegia coerulea TaxID=218851 RepID=A0A2G5EDB6_AQUCA|nr:hypothetical protein AQUCO_00900380v1 [Aquilegia coerulea]